VVSAYLSSPRYRVTQAATRAAEKRVNLGPPGRIDITTPASGSRHVAGFAGKDPARGSLLFGGGTIQSLHTRKETGGGWDSGRSRKVLGDVRPPPGSTAPDTCSKIASQTLENKG